MARHGLRLFTAVVLFGAWLFSGTRADAQVLGTQKLNWKTEAEALTVLEAKINLVATTMDSQTPGTPAYQDSEAHVSYYKAIYSLITGGSSVPESTINGLGYATLSVLDFDPTAESIRTQLYNEAVVILTN